jgi:hypothetical protein
VAIDLALTMTVRNEERFLAANLKWHYHVGVRRAYVYLDRCTDGSEAIARSFPWVEVYERDRQASSRFLMAAQQKNAREALVVARRDGVKWLLHLDADEFACGDEGPGGPEGDDLAELVARATTGTDMIILRPREAIPVRTNSAAPLSEHVYFQDGGVVERNLLDPGSGVIRRLDKLLGHKVGKSIVRVEADVKPNGAHRWLPVGGGALARRFGGFHFHFVVVGAAHFREKYGKLSEYPDTFVDGAAVPFPKQAFKEAAANMLPEEADRYYDDWVAMDIEELERLTRLGTVVKDCRLKLALEGPAAS